METVKKGSTGDAVRKWQNILGITADGVFGAQTDAETREWQKNHKLVPDGIVGPATWSTALGKPVKEQVGAIKVPTNSAPTDRAAYDIAKRAVPSLSEAERQYALTVARGEGFYGHGWGNPSKLTIEKSAKFGLTGYEGKGSNNWGAEQGSGDAGYFMHVDSHADGTLYVSKYKKHSSPEKGFESMSRIIFNGGKRGAVGAKAIKDAIAKGNLKDAVYAQHANGYFELAPHKYLEAVLRNYGILTTNIGWTTALSETGISIVSRILKTSVVLGLATALIVTIKRLKG